MCPAEGCNQPADLGLGLCTGCWGLVPKGLRRKIIRARREGRERTIARLMKSARDELRKLRAPA